MRRLVPLVVKAVVRGTCSRPGAFGKDKFDLSGLIAKWSKDGEKWTLSTGGERKSDQTP